MWMCRGVPVVKVYFVEDEKIAVGGGEVAVLLQYK